MKSHCIKPLLLGFLVMLSAGTRSSGAVTTVAWYRCGEEDINSAAGETPGKPTDIAIATTGSNLTHEAINNTGNIEWSASTPGSLPLANSTLCYHSKGRNAVYGSLILSQSDNFGVEAWVKPAVAAEGAWCTLNGQSNSVLGEHSGFGIFKDGGFWQIHFPGIVVSKYSSNEASVHIGEWQHVAVVRDSATFGTRLYVNGVLVGHIENIPNEPSPAGGTMLLGNATEPGDSPSPDGGQYFTGGLDEVRYFTFNSGEFIEPTVNHLNQVTASGDLNIPVK